jgi:hypothetical protein
MSRHHSAPASPSPHLACPLTRLPSQHLPHAVLPWHVPLALKALHAARLSLLAVRLAPASPPQHAAVMLTTDAARSAPLPPRRSALSAPLSLPRLAASSRFTLALAPPPAHRAVSMSHGHNNPALSTSRCAFPTCPQVPSLSIHNTPPALL